MSIKNVSIPTELSVLMDADKLHLYIGDSEQPDLEWNLVDLFEDYIEAIKVPGEKGFSAEFQEELKSLEQVCEHILRNIQQA